jgi:hypothetical protein
MHYRALEISGVFDDNDRIIPYDNAVKILENMDYVVVRHNYIHFYPEGGGISRYSIEYLMSKNQDEYDYILFEGNYYPIPGKNNDFFGKRKKVSESLDFERGIDPKTSIGIGKRAQIVSWFDSLGIRPTKYTIDDKLHIFVKGHLDLQGAQVSSLPDNLTVESWLDLRDTEIINLPNNLSVGGDLDIVGTPITSLTKSLKVGGEIYRDF